MKCPSQLSPLCQADFGEVSTLHEWPKARKSCCVAPGAQDRPEEGAVCCHPPSQGIWQQGTSMCEKMSAFHPRRAYQQVLPKQQRVGKQRTTNSIYSSGKSAATRWSRELASNGDWRHWQCLQRYWSDLIVRGYCWYNNKQSLGNIPALVPQSSVCSAWNILPWWNYGSLWWHQRSSSLHWQQMNGTLRHQRSWSL